MDKNLRIQTVEEMGEYDIPNYTSCQVPTFKRLSYVEAYLKWKQLLHQYNNAVVV